MILSDYHLHTKLCGHAEGELGDYAAQARKKGLCEIGFSDHLPFVYFDEFRYTMELRELPQYHRMLERLREEQKDLRVKIGIEADYVEGREDEVRR